MLTIQTNEHRIRFSALMSLGAVPSHPGCVADRPGSADRGGWVRRRIDVAHEIASDEHASRIGRSTAGQPAGATASRVREVIGL
jgi:hypothetical protein